MDGCFAGHNGTPVNMPNVFCIFERYTGDIMWRHTETLIPGKVIREVRPEVTLVARMASIEFKQSGSINVTVGLTGLLGVMVGETAKTESHAKIRLGVAQADL
ncbi:hypothetical protein SADUNF_Sadunf10G0075300 [Salix dunnii]|uniref:Amine oxidase n=1 Tax=Salix dunnii TaxID=1413687 RepID=A0A835JPA0_9ROSI|nr:hypothetical protein SADUNF_Sadunf10G0075300 [Salix dunnii]